MKKLTTKQIKKVCNLIDEAVSHLSDTDNRCNSVSYSIGYYGSVIESLTELIKNGYEDVYPFDEKVKYYEKNLRER